MDFLVALIFFVVGVLGLRWIASSPARDSDEIGLNLIGAVCCIGLILVGIALVLF